MSLVEVLRDPARRRAVVADGVQLIEEEVASKRGISGAALRAGYKTVQKLKPGIVAHALEALLPEFAPRVDPYYAQAAAQGDVRGYFRARAPEIADALLAVTDERSRTAKNAVLRKVYDSLRGQAHAHTAAAVPRLADLILKHVG